MGHVHPAGATAADDAVALMGAAVHLNTQPAYFHLLVSMASSITI
jgi:hypothetical protein